MTASTSATMRVQAVIDFLTDRLGEDEVTALNATRGPWRALHDGSGSYASVETDNTSARESGKEVVATSDLLTLGDAYHMARNDPYKTLAKVKAAREVVKEARYWLGRMTEAGTNPARDAKIAVCWHMVCALAAGYDWHPDWDEGWRA